MAPDREEPINSSTESPGSIDSYDKSGTNYSNSSIPSQTDPDNSINTGQDEPADKLSSSDSIEESAVLDPTSYRSIWKLGWPVMVGMSAQTAFTIADLYWIGTLGTQAIAAVSLVGNIIFSLFGLTQIVYIGALAMLTRRIGAGELTGRDGAEGVSAQALQLAFVIGIIIAGGGFILSGPIVGAFGAEEGVTALGVSYLAPMITSFLPAFPVFALCAVLTATGDTRTPMYVGVGVTVLNLVLNPMFIFSADNMPIWLDTAISPLLEITGRDWMLGWGVMGAGFASLVCSIVNFGVLGIAYRFRTIPFPRAGLTSWFGVGGWKTLLRIGIPGSLGMLSRPLSTVFLLGVISQFGAAGVAAFGITIRAMSLVWLFHGAISTAVSTLTGQALGAQNISGIRVLVKRSLVISFMVATVTGLIYFVWPHEIIGIFSRDSEEVLTLGALFMRLLVLSHFTTSLSMVWASVMSGAGYTRPPMIIAFLSNWAIKLPLAWALAVPLNVGVEGVWWAMFISLIFESAAIFIWYKRDRWMHVEV